MAYDAMTGTIDFAEAITCLKRGGKLRRLVWPAGVYISLAGLQFLAHSAGGNQGTWVPDAEDVLAMDWEETV